MENKIIVSEKESMRSNMKTVLRSLHKEQIQRYSRLACDLVLQHEAYREANIILCYNAMEKEADPKWVMAHAKEQGKRLAYPYCGEGRTLEALEAEDEDSFMIDAYGIRTPVKEKSKLIKPAEIDLIITPGLAFGRCGGRLGRGAGYYDRYFCRATKAFRMGFALECQVLARMPMDAHDVSMHALVTNLAIQTFNANKFNI